MHTAEKAVNGRYITNIACLGNNKETNNLVLMLDVEQILCDIIPANHDLRATDLKASKFSITPGAVAIVAGDSRVARAVLEKGPNAMGIPYLMHVASQDAWEEIQQLSTEAQAEGRPVNEKIALVLTDLEMPKMGGFTLTYRIKTDERLKKIPVVIHFSLSGSTNEDHVRRIKADGYVAEFKVNELSLVIQEVVGRTAKGISSPLVSRQLLN